jgi:hypothetical protein
MTVRSKMFGRPSRIRRKHEAPRVSVILTLDEFWLFGMRIRERLLGLTNVEADTLTPVAKFTARSTFIRALAGVISIFAHFLFKLGDKNRCSVIQNGVPSNSLGAIAPQSGLDLSTCIFGHCTRLNLRWKWLPYTFSQCSPAGRCCLPTHSPKMKHTQTCEGSYKPPGLRLTPPQCIWNFRRPLQFTSCFALLPSSAFRTEPSETHTSTAYLKWYSAPHTFFQSSKGPNHYLQLMLSRD